jgi:hypothetical protein
VQNVGNLLHHNQEKDNFSQASKSHNIFCGIVCSNGKCCAVTCQAEIKERQKYNSTTLDAGAGTEGVVSPPSVCNPSGKDRLSIIKKAG